MDDALSPGNHDYIPGAEENWEKGQCIKGDECLRLKRLSEKCRDIDSVQNISDEMIGDMDNVYDMDHCLLFHSDFRIIGGCTNPICTALNIASDGGVNRFIQFHRQIYHGQSIGIRDQEENDEKEMEQDEEGQIAYKSMSDVMERTVRFEFGQPFNLITEQLDAKWKDPKEEILNNDYCKLDEADWNELLRKCFIYYTSEQAKEANLELKEIVALKLYTDCGDLQRHFRRCFREGDLKERENLQRDFFHWNRVLESACKKATNRVSGRLYHGAAPTSR